jgi:Amt family ammonium transporter
MVIERTAGSPCSANIAWMLVAGFVVMLMQAGFGLVEAGLCRAKNATHTMSMSLMIFPLGCIAFWAYGFALGWGNLLHAAGPAGWSAALGPGTAALNRGWGLGALLDSAGRPSGAFAYGLLGLKGFWGHGLDNLGVAALFFLMMMFLCTTAAIAVGSMLERWSWKNFCLYGLWVALPFGVYAHWLWGGGWLARCGANWNLGHGAVDLAGSGVIHALGGTVALAGTLALGPRLGKYREGRPMPIPGHHVPMVVVGTLILAFGWFGLTGGCSLAGTDLAMSVIVVNTALAGAAGAVAAMLMLRMKRIKPDPTIMSNGLLAGLVAIAGSCGLVDSWAAVVIGAVAGMLVVASVFFWEKHRVDDPVGAISVHGVAGLWGLIAVGIFANGQYGAGCNGVVRPWVLAGAAKSVGYDGVRGLLYGDASQLAAQATSAAAVLLFGFVTAYACFKLSDRITPMRVGRDTELQGLDAPEMGAVAYPDFTVTTRS